MSHQKFMECIKACDECAIECEHCATACLGEQDVKAMAKCIQLDRYCADICKLASSFMSRADSTTEQYALELCALCADVCDACAAECEKHSQMAHCKSCAQACRRCAEACRNMGSARKAA